jgi:YXWGXW repeat-containing protein
MRSLLSLRTLLLAGFVGLVSLAPAPAKAQIAVGVSIRVAPPAIPVYVQPPCPVEGYMWTPGYWAYGSAGYYWVPGVWIAPPRVGLLWTPGYWGWGGGIYAWHGGYWGPHVGFYGGVNYGFGYGGVGFVGGEWRGGVFAYNTAVVHVNETVVHNVYVNRTVIVNNNVHTSFNGGPGGLTVHANAQEMAAARESHVQATSAQMSNQHSASLNHANFASENHGRPANAAYSRVNQREGNQQARIGQGVRSGQLTPGETSHLENKEAAINHEVRSDRAANGGHLTQQERNQVNHQQNAVSRDIDRDKHNARTDRPAQEHNEHPHQR